MNGNSSIRWAPLSQEMRDRLESLLASGVVDSPEVAELGTQLLAAAKPADLEAEPEGPGAFVLDSEDDGGSIVTAAVSFEEEDAPAVNWHFQNGQLNQIVLGDSKHSRAAYFTQSGEVLWDSHSKTPTGPGADRISEEADAVIEKIREQIRRPFADEADEEMPICPVCGWAIGDPEGVCTECNPLPLADEIPGSGDSIRSLSRSLGQFAGDVWEVAESWKRDEPQPETGEAAERQERGPEEEPAPEKKVKPPEIPAAATVACAACGHELPSGAKFCMECGAPRPRCCSQCGAPAKPTAKFCTQCGSRIESPS